ncbi:hypothetical protein [Bradyrhizobium sp. URHD0069]|uniref:hypothetical protein n=1 Tax=Bradyrhizobium sp. URHD0069 TaxID=1380355 RepID=UPI0012DCD389|nr:hypothetical protein [Bradyrhizobium sp. URHD0069]
MSQKQRRLSIGDTLRKLLSLGTAREHSCRDDENETASNVSAVEVPDNGRRRGYKMNLLHIFAVLKFVQPKRKKLGCRCTRANFWLIRKAITPRRNFGKQPKIDYTFSSDIRQLATDHPTNKRAARLAVIRHGRSSVTASAAFSRTA